jgi:hypothetical protein
LIRAVHEVSTQRLFAGSAALLFLLLAVVAHVKGVSHISSGISGMSLSQVEDSEALQGSIGRVLSSLSVGQNWLIARDLLLLASILCGVWSLYRRRRGKIVARRMRPFMAGQRRN